MTKHTPGPWVHRQTYHSGEPAERVVSSGATIIAALAQGNLDQEEADARLIASAPDLLAAAVSAENWLREYETGPDSGVHMLLDTLRAAIAKVEG